MLDAGLEAGEAKLSDEGSKEELIRGVEDEADEDLLLFMPGRIGVPGTEAGIGTPEAGSPLQPGKDVVLTLAKWVSSLWPHSASTPGLAMRNWAAS